MRHPNLKEITFREVFYNIKEYYNNRKQFFIKIRHVKGLRTAYLHRTIEWDDEEKLEMWSYTFEFECDIEDLDILDGNIQHIYILK